MMALLECFRKSVKRFSGKKQKNKDLEPVFDSIESG